jgi:hypothetical protein
MCQKETTKNQSLHNNKKTNLKLKRKKFPNKLPFLIIKSKIKLDN